MSYEEQSGMAMKKPIFDVDFHRNRDFQIQKVNESDHKMDKCQKTKNSRIRRYKPGSLTPRLMLYFIIY